MRRTVLEALVVCGVGALLALLPAAVDPERLAVLRSSAPAPGGGATLCEGLDTNPEWIGQRDALPLHGADNILFVDARTAQDYAMGRIPGALSLPWSEDIRVPNSMLSQFQGCKTVVAYCDRDGCADSERLAEHLLSLGVRQVRVLEGGWPDWYAAGLPVSLDPVPKSP